VHTLLVYYFCIILPDQVPLRFFLVNFFVAIGFFLMNKDIHSCEMSNLYDFVAVNSHADQNEIYQS